MEITINSIDYSGSIVDGPGIRTVLFVQGCKQRCRDCHNPSTWDINAGKTVPVNELVSELQSKSKNRKLTISGGEPLLQVPAVLELVRALDDFNIVLYTGFEIEDVPKELLDHLDYIKVGSYDKEKHCTTVDYIGSMNQRFINLRSVDE
ncbi:MAG: 4Fe-4S single cluster domain-containing protein [Candidatus Thorarchaeota archaeon]|jgi:anaerobic ribonucleoside-triphosphate reductase activating protein